jgi:hypothetical protein
LGDLLWSVTPATSLMTSSSGVWSMVSSTSISAYSWSWAHRMRSGNGGSGGQPRRRLSGQHHSLHREGRRRSET